MWLLLNRSIGHEKRAQPVRKIMKPYGAQKNRETLDKLTEGCFYVFTQAGDEADRLGKPWVNERILESRLAEIRHFG